MNGRDARLLEYKKKKTETKAHRVCFEIKEYLWMMNEKHESKNQEIEHWLIEWIRFINALNINYNADITKQL